MKKAFTMLELVMIIVVIGILAVATLSRDGSNTLREAAVQLISHIRYTQHLAMVDDKFDSTDSNWYLGRWQIFFSTANSSQSYIVMADSITSSYDANPNAPTSFLYSEVARDPSNNNKYLIGTTYSSFDSDSDEHINTKLDLKRSYGISSISISGGGTGSTARRIVFDVQGRPYRGDTNLGNAGHMNSPVDKLLQTTCIITLSDGTDNVQIAIEPETGYAHIL